MLIDKGGLYMTDKYGDVEKLFYQDSFAKKKIGSNVHKRAGKGSDRAKVKGDLRGRTRGDKPYSLNSRTKIGHVDDVLSYEVFKKWDVKKQKDRLLIWKEKFTNREVAKGLGISEAYFYKIRDQILKGDDNMNKDKLISQKEFEDLSKSERYLTILKYQEEGYTFAEMAEKWGKSPGGLRSSHSLWKKAYHENLENKEENTAPLNPVQYGDDFLFGVENEQKNELRNDGVVDVDKSNIKKSTQYEFSGLEFSLNKICGGEEASEKIQAILSLLNNDNKYKVSITISELKTL